LLCHSYLLLSCTYRTYMRGAIVHLRHRLHLPGFYLPTSRLLSVSMPASRYLLRVFYLSTPFLIHGSNIPPTLLFPTFLLCATFLLPFFSPVSTYLLPGYLPVLYVPRGAGDFPPQGQMTRLFRPVPLARYCGAQKQPSPPGPTTGTGVVGQVTQGS
jgi:hypothetical protein